MFTQQRKRKMLLLTGVLFLMMFFCMSTQAHAGWKLNGNGTYSYYSSSGKLVKKKWIGKDYYVNKKGVRHTGWLHSKNRWYFFSKSGRLLRNVMFQTNGKMYYAGEDGALYTNGIYEIRNSSYIFNKRGTRLYGKRTAAGSTYYFSKKTGRMQKNKWISTNKKYYYYGEDGAMSRNSWIGRYYVGNNGARYKKKWKDNRYLTSTGKAARGLLKVGGTYYYFNPETYEKMTDTTVTVSGKTYRLDANGKATETSQAQNGAPETSVKVERTYYTDPYVDDETLLGSIIYCEAGNQSYTGKLAVGLVIYNRTKALTFPNELREVVYQANQFTPARSGVLTDVLKHPDKVSAECRKAAADLTELLATSEPDKPIYLKIDGKNTKFPYLFFMTGAAFDRYNLSTAYKKIEDHVFFKSWS